MEQCREWFKQLVMSEKALNETKATLPYHVAYFKYKNNPLKIENYPDYENLDEQAWGFYF